MTMTAYEEADTGEMVYLIKVKKGEFEKAPFTEEDFALFRSCARGSISRHILGLSILARRIEEGEEKSVLEIQMPKSWRQRMGEVLDEAEKEDHPS